MNFIPGWNFRLKVLAYSYCQPIRGKRLHVKWLGFSVSALHGWENKMHCLRFRKNQYLFEINPKYQFMKVSKRMRSPTWTNSLSLVKTILVVVIDITSLHVKKIRQNFLAIYWKTKLWMSLLNYYSSSSFILLPSWIIRCKWTKSPNSMLDPFQSL